MANPSVFEDYFRRADLDKDGKISGAEAVGFFQGANLPQVTLAKVIILSFQSMRQCASGRHFVLMLRKPRSALTGLHWTDAEASSKMQCSDLCKFFLHVWEATIAVLYVHFREG